jgi:nucleoside 2-deoxyribosyltransferase
MKVVPFITLETLRRVRRIPIPNLRDRANLLLVELVKKYPRFNDGFVIPTLCDDLVLQAVTYSADQRKLNDLFAVLQTHDGFVELRTTGSPPHALTVKGLLAADQLQKINGASSQGFVAMSFDPGLVAVLTNGFEPAIRAAGYDPLRIDAKEFIGGISDEIMAEIRRSRFVVAGYTQPRSGVYFEAGFALGLDLPVIPTCRADEIGQLHFDIRNLNTLAWSKPDDLAVKLTARIGPGPRV